MTTSRRHWRARITPSTRRSICSRAWPSSTSARSVSARRGHGLAAALILLLLPFAQAPAEAERGRGYVALVVDDLGYRLPEGRAAVALPPGVTLSFLPHTPHARSLATAATARGHEIMLHLPMEARSGKSMGPGGLSRHMTRGELRATFREALASVPPVAGVSNHMGSLLTARPGPMGWLMEAIREHPALYFVDSRTAGSTVAARTAGDHGIAHVTRDVFLDDDPAPAAIRHQLGRLARIARTRGVALGIGHPYPATLEALAGWLPTLPERGIELIPVSRLIAKREELQGARLAAAEAKSEEVPPSPAEPTGVPCC